MGNFKTMKEWKSLLKNQTIYFEEGNQPIFNTRFVSAVHFGIPHSTAGYKAATINSPRNLILELLDNAGNSFLLAINLKDYSMPYAGYLSIELALELDNLYYFIKELQNK